MGTQKQRKFKLRPKHEHRQRREGFAGMNSHLPRHQCERCSLRRLTNALAVAYIYASY